MQVPEKKRSAVIGSGPNGLAAAILLARAGHQVTVHEGAAAAGGSARSAELTLPGFTHDICSAIHPLAVCSPCFEMFPLDAHGLEWVHPDAPAAHPLDDGTAVIFERSLDATARGLGRDGEAWRRLFEPLAAEWPALRHEVLGPVVHVPREVGLLARFGLDAIRSARRVAETLFQGAAARALFAGIAAHSMLPLEAPLSAAFGLVLGAAGHSSGWPFPRRGAYRIADALGTYLRSLGGEILTGSMLTALPEDRAVFCDVTPRQFLALAGTRLPGDYRRRLAAYRYGPAAFKIDWALDGPIPWTAHGCARAATVHLGGTLEEIAAWEARQEGRPFVLLAQPTIFDSTRAPAGKHTAWAYCHVPNGSTGDYTDAIESQVERFAPGFRARILARHVFAPAALERHNPNLVGGDINGGAATVRQILFRPTGMQYRTPLAGVFLCSASTPPGGGVHGMCGYHAVRAYLNAPT